MYKKELMELMMKNILISDGFLFRVGDRYLNPSTNIVLCSSIYAGTSAEATGSCTGVMLAYIFWDFGRGGQGHSQTFLRLATDRGQRGRRGLCQPQGLTGL